MRSLVFAVVTVVLQYFKEGLVTSIECNLEFCQPNECDDYYCTRCKAGYYLDTTSDSTRHWCNPCPSTCASCDGYEDCSKCNIGHFGYRCKLNCADGCKDDICHKNSSSCTNGCIDGYYQETDGTCSKCPSRCLQCLSSDLCSICKDTHRWGAACQYDCNHCMNCSKTGGCLTDCEIGYYLSSNPNKGGGQCRPCPLTCVSCSKKYECQTCRTGHWGTVCQNTCDHCSSCNKSGCLESSCNVGYYRDHSSELGGYICNQCPETCTSCSNYDECQSCSAKYWGTSCQNLCPNTCAECTSNTNCSRCKTGYWGSSCQFNCSMCKNTYSCSKLQGCKDGCIYGYYHEQRYESEYHCKKCLDACSTCLDNVSCSSCRESHYGPSCNKQCSKNCLEAPGRKCNETNGECFNGCKAGWFGLQCNTPCSENCTGNMCNKLNGSCTLRCTDGFTGSTCTTALGSSERSENDVSFSIELGVGLGVTVVAVAVVVVALILRRRLARPNTERDNSVQVVVAESLALNEASLNPEPDYQNLVPDTTTAPVHESKNSNECAATYEELNQNTQDGTEYSTLDETLSE